MAATVPLKWEVFHAQGTRTNWEETIKEKVRRETAELRPVIAELPI
jgi:hypothetical protein